MKEVHINRGDVIVFEGERYVIDFASCESYGRTKQLLMRCNSYEPYGIRCSSHKPPHEPYDYGRRVGTNFEEIIFDEEDIKDVETDENIDWNAWSKGEE